MAYETGTANSAPDLLDKFRLFAASEGWVINRNLIVGNGRELCLSKGNAYFNFRAYHNEAMLVNGSNQNGKYGILVNGSDSYIDNAAWDRQPGYPKRGVQASTTDQTHVMMPLVTTTGPFPAYHFFSPDSKSLYCELEATTGVFLRFGCGSLDTFSSAVSGEGRFCYATGGRHVTNSTSPSSWLGADSDSGSYALELVPFRAADCINTPNGLEGSMVRVAFGAYDNWANSARMADTSYLGMVCQGGGCHDKILREYSPNPMNGVGLLLPNVVSLNIGNEYLSPIGTVPGIRYMDMTRYLPGDEFTLGADVWKVFPWYQKGGISNERGIAYLKVV